MILQALADYYEQLSREHPERIARPGWCSRQVAFMLELSPDGELVNVIPAEEKRGWTREVPEQAKRTVGVTANLLCDNATYLLGLDAKGKPERARRCFDDARRKHLELLADVDSPVATAIRSYFETWNVEEASEHPRVVDAGEGLLAGGNLVFFVQGCEVLADRDICAAWDRRCERSGKDEEVMTCLVTGEKAPIARLHPAIKGVMGAQSMGASLVGFNARAFESYGHDEEQGLNAPVSERVTFAYTTALNYLLSDRNHHIRLGDTTIVYWADSDDEDCAALFSQAINPNFGERAEGEDDPDEKLDAIMGALAAGRQVESAKLDATFHVLGLAPNAARLSVRFFMSGMFGSMLDNLRKHHDRIDITRAPYEKKYLSPYFLLAETANPNAKQAAATSVLAGALMRSILADAPYPEALYSNVLLRVRATQDDDDRRTRKVTRGRVAIIKAYLIKNLNKEAVTVSLDETKRDTPYMLGRLFSVLERVQEEANPGIKTTIKNRYFDSANAMPSVVFPVIMKLGQNHLNKIAGDRKGLAVFYEKQIQELCNGIQGFPKRLSLSEQGDFILGYYHQTQKRYEKKNDQEG